MRKDIEPEHSKSRVNQAGDSIREETATPEDMLVIENWRASHNHILNSWQATLRNRCKGKGIIFAQRLKRRSTIFNKLQREPDMELARMHDIAGCRLIFKNIKELNQYRESLHNSRMKHIRKSPTRYDYISTPASSGYRGIHEVYAYNNVMRKDRPQEWNGLLVEIQYRTIYQHAWATAVEVAGALTGNHAKFDQGSKDHIEFFRITSEIIARAYENLNSCKPHLTNHELIKEFDNLENKIKLLQRLEGVRAVNEHFPVKDKNVILIFSEENDTPQIEIKAFDSMPIATKHYFELEKKYSNQDVDVVLVRSESGASIKNAFRNYFSDTDDFVKLVKSGLKKLKKQP